MEKENFHGQKAVAASRNAELHCRALVFASRLHRSRTPAGRPSQSRSAHSRCAGEGGWSPGAAALYRVLRALASMGVFAETAGRRFKLTPLAKTLQADGPGSLRGCAIAENKPFAWAAWLQL